MNEPETTTETKDGRASYSPEDNKIRLYVGRVPRDEYERLRAEGWTSTPKQGCDFVAHWTPARRQTALEYADLIEDEDMGPAERAADRAERFGEYRDKRTTEATGHADRYDSGPRAHGFQSVARAERAARRHDRVADWACDAWSKAEYWQRRTAGVVSHALHVSAPGVRMGRIKTLEAELRRMQASIEDYNKTVGLWEYIAKDADTTRRDGRALSMAGGECSGQDYLNPVTGKTESLWCIAQTEGVNGAQVAELWLAAHKLAPDDNAWTQHYKLRLAYENQMIEAQGGRAAHVEMIPGGWLYGKQIRKVSKSPVTGRVVSVLVKVAQVTGWHYNVHNVKGTDFALAKFETERLPVDAYRAPTPEELVEFASETKAEKKAAKATAPATIPLINPTDADAERLQALWNETERQDTERRKARTGYAEEHTPSTVLGMTQAQYSANSQGTYAKAETRGVFKGGAMQESYYNAAEKMRAKYGREVCKVRQTSCGNNQAHRVIILTDVSQKPLPAAVWEAVAVEAEAVK